MSEEKSVITSLRTIRIVCEAIVKQTFGHDYRNRMLAVMQREMTVIMRRHSDFDGDYYLRGRDDVQEQLRDGLRAVAALLHAGGDGDTDPDRNHFETHREVIDRMKLLKDLATFLIDRAEEERGKDEKLNKMYAQADAESEPQIPDASEDDIPTPSAGSVFDAYLDEINPGPTAEGEDSGSNPEAKGPDDVALT